MTICDFIGWTFNTYPATHKGLMFSMHSAFWYLEPQPNLIVPVTDLSLYLEHHGLVFDWIAFDGCYMATYEVAYELRDLTQYIVACETASPYIGFCTASIATACSTARVYGHGPLSICMIIADTFIDRNENAPSEWR
jgi:hypothetical protein